MHLKHNFRTFLVAPRRWLRYRIYAGHVRHASNGLRGHGRMRGLHISPGISLPSTRAWCSTFGGTQRSEDRRRWDDFWIHLLTLSTRWSIGTLFLLLIGSHGGFWFSPLQDLQSLLAACCLLLAGWTLLLIGTIAIVSTVKGHAAHCCCALTRDGGRWRVFLAGARESLPATTYR